MRHSVCLAADFSGNARVMDTTTTSVSTHAHPHRPETHHSRPAASTAARGCKRPSVGRIPRHISAIHFGRIGLLFFVFLLPTRGGSFSTSPTCRPRESIMSLETDVDEENNWLASRGRPGFAH